MTPKEYLTQLNRAKTNLDSLQDELLEIRLRMSGLGIGSERIGSSPNPATSSPQERLIHTAIRLEDEAAEETERLLTLSNRIRKQIQGMDNELYSRLLHERYINSKRLEQIAVDMNYSFGHIRNLHGRALTEFGKQYGIE